MRIARTASHLRDLRSSGTGSSWRRASALRAATREAGGGGGAAAGGGRRGGLRRRRRRRQNAKQWSFHSCRQQEGSIAVISDPPRLDRGPT